MKEIEITVSPQAEEFCLAFLEKGWIKMVGHSITVGDLSFSAVPINDLIIVSEIETGAKVFTMPVPDAIESYEETVLFLETVIAGRIVMLIEKAGSEKVNTEIQRLKEIMVSKHGDKPATKIVEIGISNE